MTRNRWIGVILAGLIVALGAGPAVAQEAAVAKAAAKEMVNLAERTLGRKAAAEMSTKFGQDGLEAVVRSVAKEGGEAAVKDAVIIGGKYGVQGVKAMQLAPRLFPKALSELPDYAVKPALNAIQDQPQLMEKVVSAFGSKGLQAEVKLPGTGARLLETLGADAIPAGEKLTVDEAIALRRFAEPIAQLPPAEKSKVMAALWKAPAASLDYLEKHPKVLLTSAGVGVFLAESDRFLGGTYVAQGPDGPVLVTKAGLVERVANSFADRFRTPIGIAIVVVAVTLVLWLITWLSPLKALLRRLAGAVRPKPAASETTPHP